MELTTCVKVVRQYNIFAHVKHKIFIISYKEELNAANLSLFYSSVLMGFMVQDLVL